MIVVIIGPPGAGKSKQSELLKDREHLKWLYVGKLLRQQNDPKINEYLDAGQLVQDSLVNQLVADFINQIDPSNVVVIDGFPRHLPQAEWLMEFAKSSRHALSTIIHLLVPAAVSKQRLSQRGREDDTPEAISQRLDGYEQDIAPVVGYFERQGIPIHPVDGNRGVEEVFADMDRILEHVHQSQNRV